MLPLGFIIFPYLAILINRVLMQNSKLRLFLCGFLFGFGFLFIYLFWIYNPFLVYDITAPYMFLGLLLPIFLAIFFGLGFLIFKIFNSQLLLILVIPYVFTLIEFAISNFFYGFPWFSNSLILSNNFFGFYVLKYLGTIAAGHIIISIFVLASFILYSFQRNHIFKLGLISYSSFIFFLIIPILYTFHKNDILGKEFNIDAHQILSPITKKNKKNIEENIINQINQSKADLIIFAENNFPYIIDKNTYSNLTNLIKKDKKVIIGGNTVEDQSYYNSFLLLEKDNIQVFDKQILVPFGEFLPLRKYFKFMEMISGNVDFQKGNQERIIITKDKINILPVICYEVIFDSIYKKINYNKIDIVINITNDSWFGEKIGPYQHFYIARVKSLISNKPLLRVSNNGISGFIDNNGKILKFSKLNEVSKLNYKLKIKKNYSFIFLHNLFFYYLILTFILFVIYFKKILNGN